MRHAGEAVSLAERGGHQPDVVRRPASIVATTAWVHLLSRVTVQGGVILLADTIPVSAALVVYLLPPNY